MSNKAKSEVWVRFVGWHQVLKNESVQRLDVFWAPYKFSQLMIYKKMLEIGNRKEKGNHLDSSHFIDKKNAQRPARIE